jgi:transmembrane sensor
MSSPSPASSSPGLDAAGKAIQRQAAEWLALRQAENFSPVQQAAFADWIARDPRHAAMFAEVESAWGRFDRLAVYPHSVDTAPDPDLLAPRSRRSRRFSGWAPAVLAAAALVTAGIFWLGAPFTSDNGALSALAGNEPQFMQLPDGSSVELNAGSRVSVHFTAAQRRLKLVHGEAHFRVTKDQAREFIVEADGVAVRAVGTAFNVRLQEEEVEVIVTEGSVRVAPPARALAPVKPSRSENVATLSAGQRTILSAAALAADFPPLVETLDPTEIDRALAWQTSRFNFDATPLSEVVSRLNRHSAGRSGLPRLVIHDAHLGGLLVSGRVGNDNIESFVEALEISFGVVADRRANGEIVLRPSQPK